MRHIILIGIFFLLNMVACNDTKPPIDNTEIIDFNSFKAVKSLNGELFPLMINNEKLLGATSIVVADNLLLIESGYEELMLKVFNTKGDLLTELIPNGKARNELLVITQLGYNEHTRKIWATDPSSQKIIIYNIDTLIQQLPKPESYTSITYDLPGVSPKSYVINNNVIICSYIMAEQNRFTIFDSLGRFQNTIGEYPVCSKIETTNKMLLSELWNGCFTSDGKEKLAICSNKSDLLSIYDISGKLLRQIMGPNISVPTFNIKVSGRNGNNPTISNTTNTQNHYIDMVSQGDIVWILYNSKNSKGEPLNSQIFTFDWNGNPLIRYELDRPINRLSVSTANNTIYCLDRGEGLLYTFKY